MRVGAGEQGWRATCRQRLSAVTRRQGHSCVSDSNPLIIPSPSAALAAPPRLPRLRAIALGLAAALLSACGDDTRQARASAESRAAKPKPAPYSVVEGAGGRVRGVVELAGDVPPDTLVRPTSDQRVCGESLVDVTVQRAGSRMGGVVVWLDDARRGKRLPLERRYSVANESCRLVPRVQAALVGGTLNVRSADPVMHRTRISRSDGDVLRIVRHNDQGQVVPVEGLMDEPGWLRLSSDIRPWMVGWVAVFDHPYFAVTSRTGSFELDSVPAGSYTLVARHERFREVRVPVVVTAGQETSVVVEMSAAARGRR